MSQTEIRDHYDEVEAAVSYRVEVNDAVKFIEAMLRFFSGKGTLYVSSYDFGHWTGMLAGFKSGGKVKLQTSLPDAAFLQDGYAITDDFIYVFTVECLRNIDPRQVFNQLLIYDKGSPLLQCSGNFEDVYVNVRAPAKLVKTLTDANVVASWEK